eukprot:5873889-Alexandrium_andersonii.AAC.1
MTSQSGTATSPSKRSHSGGGAAGSPGRDAILIPERWRKTRRVLREQSPPPPHRRLHRREAGLEKRPEDSCQCGPN